MTTLTTAPALDLESWVRFSDEPRLIRMEGVS